MLINKQFDLQLNNIDSCTSLLKYLNKKNFNKLIKWQNVGNSLLIQVENYYYKIYQYCYSNEFYGKIREELTKIYKNTYKLDWEIHTFFERQYIFQVEKKEKLNIITQKNMSFNQLLANWKKILIQVEKNLKFPIICKYLNLLQNYKDVTELILVRDQMNKFDDFGEKNGQIFLLDDSDWMILMLDKNKNILHKYYDIINCDFIYENLGLTKLHYDPFLKKENFKQDKIFKWFFINLKYLNNKTQKLSFKNNFYELLYLELNNL